MGDAVIFDLDGTLVDTAPDLTRATNHVLAMNGRPAVSIDDVRAMVGHGARKLIALGFARTGSEVEPDRLDELFDVFVDFYAANIAVDSRLFPGARAVLDRCRESGIALGICTNKLELLSRRLIGQLGLEGYFGAIVGQDTVQVAKPDPRPYRETLRQLGVTPARSLFVGDSEIDVRTARAAGVPIIGMSFGYTECPVSDFGPDYLAKDYGELWPIIERALDS
jgi:phosphoglycolate phosphatase